jgi:FkbM family methyltransferase
MECELRFRPGLLEREFWLVPFFCEKDKTAIDIGAAMGCYSYFMAKFSKDVIAFEPNPCLWGHLHSLLGPRAHLEEVALSNRLSEATMRVVRDNSGFSTIEEKNKLEAAGSSSDITSMTVTTRTLDSFNLCNISLIKIDVEGHEEAVIQGAQDTIARNRPFLIIESENRHNSGAPRRLAAIFSDLGYLVYYVKNRKLMEFSTLCDEDMNAKNEGRGDAVYVNNFIFIPKEQGEKVESTQKMLSRSAA